MNIKSMVIEEVENFKNTIKKDPCRKYFEPKESAEDDWDKEDVYMDALYQGYLDTCRTIHWNSKANEEGKNLSGAKKEWDKEKDKKGFSPKANPMREPLKDVAEGLQEYFQDNKEDTNKEPFNKKHTEWCKMLKTSYNRYFIEEKLTYGQAQKIINMAFKYLYCIFAEKEELEEKKGKFKYCHMPLDKFSLEWVKRYFSSSGNGYWEKSTGETLKKGSVMAWSRMEKEDYENKGYGYDTYSKNIGEYCEHEYKEQISQLQLDFVVWHKMQKIMAAEAFIKTFQDAGEDKNEKAEPEKCEADELEKLVKKKMDKIKSLINE